MRSVFADTVYWVAIANPRDQWAQAANEVSKVLAGVRIVTTDEILTEFLGHFSGLGPNLRARAASIAGALLSSSGVLVVPQTRDTLTRGLGLYASRTDKGYSLVDCVSMDTMQRMGISDALTADHHFAQEGFVLLLRQPGPTGRS